MKMTLAFLFSCSVLWSMAQQPINTSDRSNLNDIALRQRNFNKMAMISLNTWAIGNISYGTVANFQTSGEARYFHQMNAIWNTVNLGIGIPGIIGAYKQHDPMSFEELYKNQRRYETIYLFNAGLDVGYMAGGLALRQYGLRLEGTEGMRFRGYGSSLIFQGAYLFIHDLSLFILLKTNTRLLDREWEHVRMQFTGTSIRLELH